MAKAKKTNSRTRRNKRRSAERIASGEQLPENINVAEAFLSGDPKRAFEAVDVLQSAKKLPTQVERSNGRNRAVRRASGTWTEKAAAADRKAAAEADRMIDDLGKVYADAIVESGRDLTAADAAVSARLNGWGMPRQLQEAYIAAS